MDRRKFVTAVGTGTAAGTLTSCGGDSTAAGGPSVSKRRKIRWSLASSYKESLDTIYGASEHMAKRVGELTNGDFDIRIYAVGKKAPATGVFDAIQQGVAEIGHTASYYYIGKHKALAFDTAIPFGLNARQQLAWLYQGGGLELMNEILAPFGIRTLPGGSTGVQMGGWFRNEINSLEDMRGLTMRIPGWGGEIMKRLGVNATTIGPDEVYQALETGRIDAVEWVGPHDDLKLGFHQIAKNYYYPGWWEPGANISFYINQAAFDELPEDFQAALEIACSEATLWMMNSYDVKNPAAVPELEKHGVVMRPFPDDVMEAAKRETNAFLDETVGSDESVRKVYENWSQFRDDSNRWFSRAEQELMRW